MSSWFASGGLGLYGTYANLGLYGALVTYGSLELTQTSPRQSFVEPITLAEAKYHLRLPERSPADPMEDNWIQGFIVAARQAAELRQRRDLVVKQMDLHFDYWPNFTVQLGTPLRSVDLAQYKDADGIVTTMAEDVDFVVDRFKIPGIIIPPWNKTWPTFTPWPSSAILLRFTSGYAPDDEWWAGDTGARVKAGMLALVSEWFFNRLRFGTSIEEFPLPILMCLDWGARQLVC